jgi:hypothetical protein
MLAFPAHSQKQERRGQSGLSGNLHGAPGVRGGKVHSDPAVDLRARVGFNRAMQRAAANNRNTNNAVPLRVDD